MLRCIVLLVLWCWCPVAAIDGFEKAVAIYSSMNPVPDKDLLECQNMLKRCQQLAGVEKMPDLRFGVGDSVRCFINGWKCGKVVHLWYRDCNWPLTRASAPYQVRLDDGGGLIFAPEVSGWLSE